MAASLKHCLARLPTLSQCNTLNLLKPKSLNPVNNRALSASSSRCSSPKLYELRMYTLQPQFFKSTLDLFEQKAHLRTQYSKLFGYWTAEIGSSPTQFVHIWEYDSLAHRRQVRNSLAADDAWKTEFLSTIMKSVSEWQTALMVTSPGTHIDVNFQRDDSAVYLLEQAKKPTVGENNRETSKGEHVVGRFEGILGPTNVEYTLSRFQDVDDAASCAQNRSDIEGKMILLHPANFSPIH